MTNGGARPEPPPFPGPPFDDLALRPATDGDFDALWHLHRVTMAEPVAATWGWDEAWQAEHFRERWRPERLTVITWRDRLIGVFDLQERSDDLYLETIEIDPAFQSTGIGTAILSDILAAARERGSTVRLHVLRVNRARHFYEHLGFTIDEETDTRFAMSKAPDLEAVDVTSDPGSAAPPS